MRCQGSNGRFGMEAACANSRQPRHRFERPTQNGTQNAPVKRTGVPFGFGCSLLGWLGNRIHLKGYSGLSQQPTGCCGTGGQLNRGLSEHDTFKVCVRSNR
jgi:hypothetical protein